MYKLANAERKRKKVEHPAIDDPVKAEGVPPQFTIDAAEATHIEDSDRAIDSLERGISQDCAPACKCLRDTSLSRAEQDKAIEWLEKARQGNPQSAAIHGEIGQVLMSFGRVEEAVEHFSTAIKQQIDMGNVRLLVDSMERTGLTEEAIDILEGILEVNPQRSDVMFELAWFFEKIGRLSQAEAWYKRNAELTHSHEAYNQLGLICRAMGRISEAVEYMQRTVKLKPLFGGGWDNLCMGLMEMGCIEESIELSRIIVINTPNVPQLHSNFLLRLHYSPNLDPQAIFEEHVKWGQRYAPMSMAKTSHNNTVALDRKLRIGYLSPDFAKCVAVCHVMVLLDSHNRDAVELYGYGNVERPDETTASIQTKFDHYRDIWHVSDDAVARFIEQDKIDILVDLAGHTRNNRLVVLAYKPAPVQVSYLGYADTTGMQAIDYMLTDNWATPPQSQTFYTEKLYPLPKGYCCYKPLEEAPSVNPLPAIERGHVTFGAFTNVWRLNKRLLQVWGDILKCTENSKLILGFRGGNDEGLRHRFLSQFEQCGVSRERIEIRGVKPYHIYLKQYNDVDIVLDTFPENGWTTTCDALWMGVPVISLTGQHQVERNGLSILSAIEMTSFAVETPSDYVAKAVATANDRANLLQMRGSLRARLAESPLCDSGRFAHDLELAYRAMWHRWCHEQGAAERTKKKVAQAPVVNPIQAKEGRPQFLVDAAEATSAGDYDKAIDCLKQGIAHDSFAAYRGIGNVYLSCGEKEKAIKWLQMACECRPESVSDIECLSNIFLSLNRKEEAVANFRTAIRQQTDIENLRALTESMRRMGLTDDAIEILEGIIQVDPELSEIMFVLAWFLQNIGRLDQAEAWYRAYAEQTRSPEAYNQLGIVCRNMGRISEAIDYTRKAVTLKPDLVSGWNNLANFLMEFGSAEEGIELFRTLVEKMPDDATLRSNFIFSLHYSPELNQQALFEEHRKWGQKHAPRGMAKISHSNTIEPERKLRIGYISPDFRNHVAAGYIELFLEAHNRTVVEVHGYGNVEHPDDFTSNLRTKFDHYRDIWHVDDEAVARIIEQDRIDVLVELAGHSTHNRLLVLARKPAPVQVTYLGYADTTGMEAVDYILTDPWVTPPAVQRFYTEKLFPLPKGLFCYKPLTDAPAVNPLPAVKNGYVTFGAFIKAWRLNKRVLGVWADILRRVDHARLILGFRGGDDERLRHRFLSQFEQCGISRERIDMGGMKPYHLYLKQYNDVDIVLDTFPENGGTTTCDALWMGVPVVSLTGQHQVERNGLSILSALGMESFSTTTPSDYIARTVAVAGDLESLSQMRTSMRQKMMESPICDSKRFAHDLESAYREMWRRWCQTQGVSAPNGQTL